MDDLGEFEENLEEALEVALRGVSVNRATLGDIREWLREYLRDRRSEVARFPETEDEPHWNLVAADDSSEEGFFVAMFFSPDTFSLLLGRGSAEAVRSYCDCEASLEPAEARKELSNRFKVFGEELILPLAHGFAWIETGG